MRRTIAVLFLVGSLLCTSRMRGQTEIYSRAEAAIRSGDIEGAKALLTEALRQQPNAPKALNLFGIALTAQGELRQANEEFLRALEMDPVFIPALKNIAINEIALHENRSAEAHLKSAAALSPDDPVIHAYIGETAFERGEFQTSREQFASGASVVDRNPELRAHLGIAEIETGERDEGVALLQGLPLNRLSPQSQFQAALSLAGHGAQKQAIPLLEEVSAKDPENADVRFDLALCYLETGANAEALPILEHLAKDGTGTAEIYSLLGEAYEGSGQTKRAVEALRHATELFPNEEGPYLDLVALCIKYDSYDLGMEVLTVGLRTIPGSAKLIFDRGVLQAMHNRSDLAERDFLSAAALAPEKDFTYSGLALTYLQTAKSADAVELLKRRTREHPDDYMLYYLLGRALTQQGHEAGTVEMGEALSAFKRSIVLNPNFAGSRLGAGRILVLQDHLEDASVQLERAYALSPTDTAVCAQLALVYKRRGEVAKFNDMLSELKSLNERERASSQHVRLVDQSAGAPEDRGKGRTPDRLP